LSVNFKADNTKENMMSNAASNYLENTILDYIFSNAVYTPTDDVYLALFNNTSGNAATNLEAGTLTDEVSASGTAYARQVVTFGAASGGIAANDITVTFPAATASWGSVTHVAIMDADTAGNVLFYGAVTTAKTIDTGDTFQVATGNLTIQLS
jgi:hypothetical protein